MYVRKWNIASRYTIVLALVLTMFLSQAGLVKALYYPPRSKTLIDWSRTLNNSAWKAYSIGQGSSINDAMFYDANSRTNGLDPSEEERLKSSYPPLEARTGTQNATTVEYVQNKLQRFGNFEHGFIPADANYGVAMIMDTHAHMQVGDTYSANRNYMPNEGQEASTCLKISAPATAFDSSLQNWGTLQNAYENGLSGYGTRIRDFLNANTGIQSAAGQRYYNNHKTQDNINRWFTVRQSANGTMVDSGLTKNGNSVSDISVVNSSFGTTGDEASSLTFNARYRQSTPNYVSPMNSTDNGSWGYKAKKSLYDYKFTLAKVHNMLIFDAKSNSYKNISANIIMKNIVVGKPSEEVEIALSKTMFIDGHLSPKLINKNLTSYDLEIYYYEDDNESKPANLGTNLSYGSIDSLEELSFHDIPGKQAVKYILATPDTFLSYSYQRPNEATSGNKAHIFTATQSGVIVWDQGYNGHRDQRFLAAAFMDITGSSVINYRSDRAAQGGYVGTNTVLAQYATPLGIPMYSPATITKGVSDANQTNVQANTLNTINEKFTYIVNAVQPVIALGDEFSAIRFTDDLADILKVDVNEVKIYDYLDVDVTQKFDISISDSNELQAISNDQNFVKDYRWGQGFKLVIPSKINQNLPISSYEKYVDANKLKINNVANFSYKVKDETAIDSEDGWAQIANSDKVTTTVDITPSLKLIKRQTNTNTVAKRKLNIS